MVVGFAELVDPPVLASPGHLSVELLESRDAAGGHLLEMIVVGDEGGELCSRQRGQQHLPSRCACGRQAGADLGDQADRVGAVDADDVDSESAVADRDLHRLPALPGHLGGALPAHLGDVEVAFVSGAEAQRPDAQGDPAGVSGDSDVSAVGQRIDEFVGRCSGQVQPLGDLGDLQPAVLVDEELEYVQSAPERWCRQSRHGLTSSTCRTASNISNA